MGSVTVESESIAYNQLLSISGNVLDKVDVSGGVAASANASGTNEPAYIQAVFMIQEQIKPIFNALLILIFLVMETQCILVIQSLLQQGLG